MLLKRHYRSFSENQDKVRLFGSAIYNKFNSNFILFFETTSHYVAFWLSWNSLCRQTGIEPSDPLCLPSAETVCSLCLVLMTCFNFLNIYFMCMGVLHTSVFHIYAWCSGKPEEGTGFTAVEVRGSHRLLWAAVWR